MFRLAVFAFCIYTACNFYIGYHAVKPNYNPCKGLAVDRINPKVEVCYKPCTDLGRGIKSTWRSKACM